jgi:hypothetical protein
MHRHSIGMRTDEDMRWKMVAKTTMIPPSEAKAACFWSVNEFFNEARYLQLR